jgi:hypothetical protein
LIFILIPIVIVILILSDPPKTGVLPFSLKRRKNSENFDILQSYNLLSTRCLQKTVKPSIYKNTENRENFNILSRIKKSEKQPKVEPRSGCRQTAGDPPPPIGCGGQDAALCRGAATKLHLFRTLKSVRCRATKSTMPGRSSP